jgi:hypothetical protein
MTTISKKYTVDKELLLVRMNVPYVLTKLLVLSSERIAQYYYIAWYANKPISGCQSITWHSFLACQVHMKVT